MACPLVACEVMLVSVVMTPVLMLHCRVTAFLTLGMATLSWTLWAVLQCALAPAHAFVLLSSYPGE